MSYPRFESAPAAAPRRRDDPAERQAEADDALRQNTIDALYRTLSRLAGQVGRDWERCGKAACLRSRRCRGRACVRGL